MTSQSKPCDPSAAPFATVMLVPVEGGDSIPINKPIVLIGRHTDCDILLDEGGHVSRRHCVIVSSRDGIFLRDLGSMNGVLVNGRKSKPQLRLPPVTSSPSDRCDFV